jgi:Uma2 family endonuclease
MPTFVAEDVHLEIPEWVTNLAAFRRWTDEPSFPEKGNIWWLCGKVWADMSQEQIFTHVDIKGEIYHVLKGIVRTGRLGRIFTDGLLLTNDAADLSGNPDATFISHHAIETNRVVLVEGKEEGFTEAVGSPEMVLEVVSKSSEEKDYTILNRAYYAAGIDEHWLVDARKDPLQFDILRRTPDKFAPTRKQAGWLKSAVFGKSFRLFKRKDDSGNPEFILEVK